MGEIARVGNILRLLSMINTDFFLNAKEGYIDVMVYSSALKMLVRRSNDDSVKEMPVPILVEARRWKKMRGFSSAGVRVITGESVPVVVVEEAGDISFSIELKMPSRYDEFVRAYRSALDDGYVIDGYFVVPVTTFSRLSTFVRSTTRFGLTLSRDGGKIEVYDESFNIDVAIDPVRVNIVRDGFDEEYVELDPGVVGLVVRMANMLNITDVAVAIAHKPEVMDIPLVLVVPAVELGERASFPDDFSGFVEALPVG